MSGALTRAERRAGVVAGAAWCGLVALAAFLASSLLERLGWHLNAQTAALGFGLVLGNMKRPPDLELLLQPGVDFVRKHVLRAAVVLFGVQITWQGLVQAGPRVLLVDAAVLLSTFCVAWIVGRHVLGMDRDTTILIGAGASICGASAVLATQQVLRAKPEQATVALATVVVFGTAAFGVYPGLAELNLHTHLIGGGAAGFARYIGSTMHEVAQVVATARLIEPGATDVAVLSKLGRVAMLAPFLAVVAAFAKPGEAESTAPSTQAGGMGTRILGATPMFPVVFLLIVVANSVWPLAPQEREAVRTLDVWLLSAALAAAGLATKFSAWGRGALRPLALALCLFLWLVVGGAVINALAES